MYFSPRFARLIIALVFAIPACAKSTGAAERFPNDNLLPPPAKTPGHWAFKPIAVAEPPVVKSAGWVRTPVDSFIAAQHEARGLKPAAEAPRRVLIRRLSLDLLGLPPTAEEIASFEADESEGAYQRLVERLLASPHYGERWGRHWLDLARWADTEGYEMNHPRPTAWRYRDYVIRAFNDDKPYDRFLREQIAGDELVPYLDDNLVATGFLAAARYSANEEDKDIQRNDVLVDIVNATSSVVLGLTFQCAQCHNHKFDRISQRDYYRLMAFFVKGQPHNYLLKDDALWKEYRAAIPTAYDPAVKLRDAILEPARARLREERRKNLSDEERAALDVPENKRDESMQKLAKKATDKLRVPQDQVEKSLAGDDKSLYESLKKKIAELEKQLPAKPQAWSYFSPATSPHTLETLAVQGFSPLPYDAARLKALEARLLVRGEVKRPGPIVEPGFPEAIAAAMEQNDRGERLESDALPNPLPKRAGAATRSQLVDWLVDPANPLTPRVWANRVWQYHFGRGLVATSSDFGAQGAEPTHSALLDYLAHELVHSGWSTKHLHRLIVLSNTYRQASSDNLANRELDPENMYSWHWQPRRLEAEAIRDSVLVAAGTLDKRPGGPSVPANETEKSTRRTVYLWQKRDAFPAVQTLFDGAKAVESCPGRTVTTVALQPLYLLNSEFMTSQARSFAEHVVKDAADDREKRVAAAFVRALGRVPEAAERKAADEFLGTEPTAAKWEQFCQALLNTNEFVYIE
jgi:hypothetical protein